MADNKSYAKRLYGKESERKAAAAKGRVFPGNDSARSRVVTPNQALDAKRDHDMILDEDGKVRKYKREKSA